MAHFSCSPVVQGPFRRSPGNSPYQRPFQSRYNDYWPREALRASPAINNQSNVNQSSVNQSNVSQPSVNPSNVNQSSVHQLSANQPNVNQSRVHQSNVNQVTINQVSTNELKLRTEIICADWTIKRWFPHCLQSQVSGEEKKRNLTLSLNGLSRNQFSNWLQICDGRSKKVLYVSSRSSTYVGSIAEWSATTWLISFWGVAWWKQSK